MLYHALVEYIRDARACGAQEQIIRSNLLHAGWYPGDVQDAFESVDKERWRKANVNAVCEPRAVANVPHPPWYERLMPHSYSGHAVAITMFVLVIGALVYAMFLK